MVQRNTFQSMMRALLLCLAMSPATQSTSPPQPTSPPIYPCSRELCEALTTFDKDVSFNGSAWVQGCFTYAGVTYWNDHAGNAGDRLQDITYPSCFEAPVCADTKEACMQMSSTARDVSFNGTAWPTGCFTYADGVAEPKVYWNYGPSTAFNNDEGDSLTRAQYITMNKCRPTCADTKEECMQMSATSRDISFNGTAWPTGCFTYHDAASQQEAKVYWNSGPSTAFNNDEGDSLQRAQHITMNMCTVEVSYNCLTKEVWSAEKTEWCCENEQLGCQPTCADTKEACMQMSPTARDVSFNGTAWPTGCFSFEDKMYWNYGPSTAFNNGEGDSLERAQRITMKMCPPTCADTKEECMKMSPTARDVSFNGTAWPTGCFSFDDATYWNSGPSTAFNNGEGDSLQRAESITMLTCPVPCCLALTASCMACSTGQTEQEYCEENPDTVGCPEQCSAVGGGCTKSDPCCGGTWCNYENPNSAFPGQGHGICEQEEVCSAVGGGCTKSDPCCGGTWCNYENPNSAFPGQGHGICERQQDCSNAPATRKKAKLAKKEAKRLLRAAKRQSRFLQRTGTDSQEAAQTANLVSATANLRDAKWFIKNCY